MKKVPDEVLQQIIDLLSQDMHTQEYVDQVAEDTILELCTTS